MPESHRANRLRLIVLFVLAAVASYAVDLSSVPKPTGYVSDLANVLSPGDKETLESFCTKVDQQLSAQFAIVTIKTLGDQPIEDFTLDLGRRWGVGDKKNEGLLLLLVIQDHKDRIEVGRGLEPYITDAISGDTLRAMRPLMRQGNYSGAVMQAVQTLAARIAEGKNISFGETLPVPIRPQPQREPHSNTLFGIPIGILVFLFILVVFFLASRGGGGRGTGGGFWTGLLLSSLLNSGRGGRGGGWGGGGGFGGGSDGGGGFGGFGGGDFGGGGASSDW
jgi:uncharacterized protein